jgi:hypothetical protein
MKQILLAAGVVFVLTGCDLRAQDKPDPALVRAQADATANPANRFTVAGTRQYKNGTEVYVLDGRSGQVCYYFVASGQGDETAQKTDSHSCAGEALNPL